jgi:hypothetical protein
MFHRSSHGGLLGGAVREAAFRLNNSMILYEIVSNKD